MNRKDHDDDSHRRNRATRASASIRSQSIPKDAKDVASASFVSDLGPMLAKAPLWVHGHVHDSFDYLAHGSRVVASPRGYPLNQREVNMASWLRFENEGFDPMCLIEVTA